MEKKNRFSGAALRAATAFILSVLLLLPLSAGIACGALDDPVITDTNCAYLYNITNDVVLYQKNLEMSIYPASTVKIMFALVAIEKYQNDWDTEITVTKEMVSGVTGNNINLRANEIVTFRDMINCVIIGGSNDCASVIAYTICGNKDDFVELMNQKAVALGMYDTTYKNITGLHNQDMHTTLSDIVKLVRYAIVQYKYYDIAREYKYEMDSTNRSGTRKVYTRNAFMTSYYSSLYYSEDVSGINAGSTDEAGFCAVVTAEHDGTSYLAIAMGSGSDGDNIYSFTSIRSMLDWAYDNFRYVTIVKDSEVIKEVPVGLSAEYDSVALYAERTVDVFMEGDVNADTDIRRTVVITEESLNAPLQSGDKVGYLTLSYKDRILEKVGLIVRSDVPRSETLYISSILTQIASSEYFLIAVIISVIAAIVTILLKSVSLKREKELSEYKKSRSPADNAIFIASPDKKRLSDSRKSGEVYKTETELTENKQTGKNRKDGI